MEPSQDDRRSRAPAFKRIGLYLPMFAILGIGVPVLIYLTVMQTLGWHVPALGSNGLMSVAAADSRNVVLYASTTTTEHFARSGGNYETLLTPWRDYFAQRKTRVSELSKPSQIRELENGVVILPSAVALSDEEREALLSFRARGGAILSTWATGARSGNGDWHGWQFLEALGARMLGEIPATAEAGYLVLNGESPVAHSLPAGQRLALTKTSEPLLRLQGERVAARFMNWARIPDPARRDEGAIVYTESRSDFGRSVLFAFSESTWEARPAVVHQVIDDALRWLRRDPALVRGAWPGGHRAAQVVEMDTEDGFPNALVFAAQAQAVGYRPTFYVLTSVGRRFPEVMSQLERDFELGYHGDVHDSFKGQPEKLQDQRMQIMRAEMATVVSDTAKVTGFRAPLEGYDATTERLLPKYGVRHHVVDPARSEARLPLLVKVGDEAGASLVVLPRTQRDDINLAAQNLSIEETTATLVDDFELVVEHGGLGLLSVHTQNYYPEGVLTKAMPAYLRHVAQSRERVWLASAGEVADWWWQRDRLKLSSSNAGKRLDFNLTVTGTEPLAGASVIVMLPQKGIVPVVQPMKIGLPRPSVKLLDDYRAAVVFESLEPGDYAYQAHFAGTGQH